MGVRPTTELTCAHAEQYASSGSWLRVLLSKSMMGDNDNWKLAGMPFSAAVETCAACEEGAPHDPWYSPPFLWALGPEYAELVEKMLGLDARIMLSPGRSCERTALTLSTADA